MVKCTLCGKYCKNLAGLSGHIQFKHLGYKLQSTTVLKRKKINQETHLSHQQSYQPSQATFPLYQERMQDTSVNNGYQDIPDVQRRQGIPPSYLPLIQQIEEYERIRKLIEELTHRDKAVPNSRIEQLIRNYESLKLKVEKFISTKESPVKDTIASIGTQKCIRREENLEIENVIKKAQDNVWDPLSSFSSRSDNKFFEEKEKIKKAWDSYCNIRLELIRYEWEVKHGNPVVDAFLVGGLNLIQQIGEALENKPKKQEINPSPKRVTLIPSPERVTLIPFEENG